MQDQRYKKIIDLALDAIVSINVHQDIVLFNAGAEAIFGHNRREVVGRPVAMLLPERFRGRHRLHVESFGAESVEARYMNERGQIIGLRKNGEEFPARGSILKTGRGADLNYTLILRDITAYEKIRTELRDRINELENANFDLRLEKQKLERTEVLLDQLLGQSHSYGKRTGDR